MDNQNDNRDKHRFARSESVALEVLSPSGEPLPERKIIHTQTLDFSGEGIKVRMAEEIPDGSLVSLIIEPLEYDVCYKLKGQVRWCRALLDFVYEAGVLISDDGTQDYRDWMAYINGTPDVKVEEPH